MVSRQLNQSGQATVEYILILSVVVAIFVTLRGALGDLDLAGGIAGPIQTELRRAYQYGDADTIGPDERNGPVNHIRATVPAGKNFRIFMNPGPR